MWLWVSLETDKTRVESGEAPKGLLYPLYILPKSFFRLLLPFALPVELLLDTV